MIGNADNKLMKSGKFGFDFKTQSYYLFRSNLNSSSDSYNQNAISVGNASAQASYSLKLSENLKQGITIKDNTSGMSFNLKAQFSSNNGKNIFSHIVYPLTNMAGADDVYTVKHNGLQEDIILNQPTNQLRLTYKLSLPNYLVARNISNGAVGIYSADPALFNSNISYGSNADRQKVAEAKIKSPKNYLVFILLPPVIKDSSLTEINPSSSTSSLTLKNDNLTLVAKHLSKLSYPLDIDPSVIVNSATTWGQSGNNEGDVTIESSQINEANLTGGALASWSTTTALPETEAGAASATNNGYIYVIGGCYSGCGYASTVEYALTG